MSNISSVQAGILEYEGGLTIELGNPQWFEWLESASSFRYVPKCGELPYTVRKETTRGNAYWYGYRKRSGKLHKRYIGKSKDLTESKLEEVASLLSTPSESRQKQVTQKSFVTKAELSQLRLDVSELQRSLGQVLSTLNLHPESSQKLEVTQEVTQKVNKEAFVAHSEEIDRLQSEIARLHNELSNALGKLASLQDENESLRQELEERHERSPIQPSTALPDLYAIRDRVLQAWKVAKRAESKERLREFADRMIAEIVADDTGYTFIQRLLSDIEQERKFNRGSTTTALTWEQRYREAVTELRRRGVNWG